MFFFSTGTEDKKLKKRKNKFKRGKNGGSNKMKVSRSNKWK